MPLRGGWNFEHSARFSRKFFHAAEGSPAYGFVRDAIEPNLHLIEPGGIGGSKVHMKSWSRGEPAPKSAMLMRGVIIHDDVRLQILRHALFNLAEKTEIFLMPMAGTTLCEHLAVRRVQRGK